MLEKRKHLPHCLPKNRFRFADPTRIAYWFVRLHRPPQSSAAGPHVSLILSRWTGSWSCLVFAKQASRLGFVCSRPKTLMVKANELQGRILQRFKVFSAHPAVSQAHILITSNQNTWIFSSLIFVGSAQFEYFFFFDEQQIAFFQR